MVIDRLLRGIQPTRAVIFLSSLETVVGKLKDRTVFSVPVAICCYFVVKVVAIL